MSAYDKLIVEGKKACDALAAVSPWSTHAWARAVRILDRAGNLGTIGLSEVYLVSKKTGADPETVADLLNVEMGKLKLEEARQQIAEDAIEAAVEEHDSPCAAGCKPNKGDACGGSRCT